MAILQDAPIMNRLNGQRLRVLDDGRRNKNGSYIS